MLIRIFVLLLVLGTPVVSGEALAQTNVAQAPILCGENDKKIEDGDCLKKLNGSFKRDGDRLTVNLDGGKSKTYVGNQAACDGENVDVEKCLVFHMKGYFPQIQSYLVGKGVYEGLVYLLINRKTGSETVMSEIPALSPGAKYLVSIDQSDVGERDYDIAIWSTGADRPKQEFTYKAKQYENWEIVAWKNDTHISMKAFVNGKTSYDQEAELVRKDKGWALVLGRKTDRPR